MLGQHWPSTFIMMQYYSHNCRYSFRLRVRAECAKVLQLAVDYSHN